jgi:hypothetical protein
MSPKMSGEKCLYYTCNMARQMTPMFQYDEHSCPNLDNHALVNSKQEKPKINLIFSLADTFPTPRQ